MSEITSQNPTAFPVGPGTGIGFASLVISSGKSGCLYSYNYVFFAWTVGSGLLIQSTIHPHGDGQFGLRPGWSTAKGRAGSLARPLPLASSHTPRLGRL